jgi:hypothetical protein
MACVSLLDALGRFLFGSGFFGLGRILIKIHGLYSNHGLLQVKNYSSYSPMTLVGSRFFGQVASGGSCSDLFKLIYGNRDDNFNP